MYDKVIISGTILVESGLHIGGSTQFSAIGAVDSPVIRDALTNHPIIPGSSLKGKMRTLLARKLNDNNIVKKPNDDKIEITRLFGNSIKIKVKEGFPERIIRGRLQFSDMQIKNWDDLKAQLLDTSVEVKFENTIDRITAEAKPRQIERIVRGAKFEMNLMYDAYFREDEVQEEEEQLSEIEEDFKNIAEGLKLLQLDYLGGNGTRGYGKITFSGITVKSLLQTSDKLVQKIEDLQSILNSAIQAFSCE